MDLLIDVHIQVVSPLFSQSYMPKYASSGAAGVDLHACIEQAITVQPGDRVRIPTGIAIQLPHKGLVALVYARSGLAWRSGVALSNGVGVIDSDYTGEIQVLLTNFGDAEVTIEPGDRIAQMVISPIHLVNWVQTDALSETSRGEKGFGSTGVR